MASAVLPNAQAVDLLKATRKSWKVPMRVAFDFCGSMRNVPNEICDGSETARALVQNGIDTMNGAAVNAARAMTSFVRIDMAAPQHCNDLSVGNCLAVWRALKHGPCATTTRTGVELWSTQTHQRYDSGREGQRPRAVENQPDPARERVIDLRPLRDSGRSDTDKTGIAG